MCLGREMEVFYLPGYSPELNPDEGLNGDPLRANDGETKSSRDFRLEGAEGSPR
jgi:hypothetical protein